MIEFLKSLLAKLLGKVPAHSVDSVLDTFHTAIEHLEAVAAAKTDEAAAHIKAIEAAIASKLEAEAESLRATTIAQKMSSIFHVAE